jgi:hypothetical protein
VCDWKNYFCVNRKTAGYLCDFKKKKRTELVCDCNYLASMIATRSYVLLQILTVSVWLKNYLVIWYMITSLGSVWLQKLFFVCDWKNCWLFLWLQKKKRTEPVWDCTILRACLQLGVLCGWKPWLCLCGWKAIWLFDIWLQAWVVCDCKNYFLCVIAKTTSYFYDCKRKKELNQCVIALFCVRTCNQEFCVVASPGCVCVVEKLLGYLVYDCKPGSVWLQKLFFVCDCKNCWLFLRLQKKKELNLCVIALFCLRACNQELCVVAKSNCLSGWKATWLFGIWLQA